MFKLLIIILTTFSTSFAMDWSKNEQNINKFYDAGQSLESGGSFEDAARWFAKAAKIELPDPATGPLGDFDPYKTARDNKQNAIKEIANMASQLEKNKKYDEALKIYQELSDTFSAQIKKIESIKKDSEQLAQVKTLITQNRYDEALQILATLKSPEISDEVNQLKTQINISQQNAAEAVRQEQERLAQEAQQQKLTEVRRLINAEDYDAASTILNTLPADNQEVTDLKEDIANGKEIKRAQELAEKNNNYQEAYKILAQLKDKGSLKANELDRQLIKKQLEEADNLANSGDYAKAYAILNILKANRPGQEVETETSIKAKEAQKKQQDQEAQQRAQEEQQRKAAEAERKRIAQEEVERQKQLQEAQRRIAEEAKKQKLAQEETERKKQLEEEAQRQAQEEQRKAEEAKERAQEEERKALEEAQKEKTPDKPLAKDLNNAFNHLADTLTLITKNIAESPTGSKTTHLLEAPSRFRPRPPGRAGSIKRLPQKIVPTFRE